MSVTVYTRTTCGPCRTLKHWLKTKNVAYDEKNVDEDPRFVDELLKLTNFQMVPVVVVNGENVIGANFARLNELLTKTCEVC